MRVKGDILYPRPLQRFVDGIDHQVQRALVSQHGLLTWGDRLFQKTPIKAAPNLGVEFSSQGVITSRGFLPIARIDISRSQMAGMESTPPPKLVPTFRIASLEASPKQAPDTTERSFLKRLLANAGITMMGGLFGSAVGIGIMHLVPVTALGVTSVLGLGVLSAGLIFLTFTTGVGIIFAFQLLNRHGRQGWIEASRTRALSLQVKKLERKLLETQIALDHFQDESATTQKSLGVMAQWNDQLKAQLRTRDEALRELEYVVRKLGLVQDCDPAMIDDYLGQIPPAVHAIKDALRRRVGEIISHRLVSYPGRENEWVDKYLVPDPHARQDLVKQGITRIACIGKGGMGEVWTAHCLNTVVAVKTLLSRVIMMRGYETVLHFRREIALQERFRDRPHPNVVPVLHYQAAGEASFLIAPYVKNGLSLRQFINRVRSQEGDVLSISEALTILYFVVLALEDAKNKGIIHRDIKPENIMLVQDEAFLKVLDFGSAKDPSCGVVRKEELRSMLCLAERQFQEVLDSLFVNSDQDELVIRQDEVDMTVEAREARIAEKVHALRSLGFTVQENLIGYLKDKLREKLTAVLTGSMFSGTYDYAGPERICPQELEGYRLEHLIDIYALGMLFHEMHTGKTPREFGVGGESAWRKYAEGDEPTLSQRQLALYPPQVQTFIQGLCDRNWRNRFRDYAEIKQEILALLQSIS